MSTDAEGPEDEAGLDRERKARALRFVATVRAYKHPSGPMGSVALHPGTLAALLATIEELANA